MKKMKSGVEICQQKQTHAPKNWEFVQYENTGENFFSGRFEIFCYVSPIRKLELGETSIHFLVSSERLSDYSKDFLLTKTVEGGLAASEYHADGHVRLVHVHDKIWENERSAHQIFEFLEKAAERNQRVRIAGKTVHLDAQDPDLQDIFFNGWGNSCSCPVVVPMVVDLAPTLLQKGGRALKSLFVL